MKLPFGKFKLTKEKMVTYVVLLLMMLTLAANFPMWVKVVALAGLIGYYFWQKRGNTLFNQAVNLLRQGREQEAVLCFRRAYELGIKDEQKLAVGSVLAQHGYPEEGLSVIRRLQVGGLDSSFRPQAQMIASVCLWNSGDSEGAIEALESLVEDGISDESVTATLSVYLIASGHKEGLDEVLPEKEDYSEVSTGMLDNYLWRYIAEEAWEKAGAVAAELDERDIQFPEGLYHLGLYDIHSNKLRKGKDHLEESLGKTFLPSAVIKAEFIESFLRAIEGLDALTIDERMKGCCNLLAKGDSSVLDKFPRKQK